MYITPYVNRTYIRSVFIQCPMLLFQTWEQHNCTMLLVVARYRYTPTPYISLTALDVLLSRSGSKYYVFFVRRFRRGPSLSILGLGNSCFVCTEMTCQANPRLKIFGAVWTADSGCLGTLGNAVFPVFPTLLSCCDSVSFLFLGTIVYS